MKKVSMVLLFILVTMGFYSCGTTPKVDYECTDYFTKNDWDLTTNKSGDTILFYNINKNISLKNDFPSAVDSTKFSMTLYSEQFNKLPTPDVFSKMLHEVLFKSKLSCKNQGTYKPYEINTMFTDGDSTINIKVDFFASNAYGTPGELHGYYKYDSKTYKLIDENVMEY